MDGTAGGGDLMGLVGGCDGIGGGDGERVAQSVQSVPKGQYEYSEPGPPSSQSPSIE